MLYIRDYRARYPAKKKENMKTISKKHLIALMLLTTTCYTKTYTIFPTFFSYVNTESPKEAQQQLTTHLEKKHPELTDRTLRDLPAAIFFDKPINPEHVAIAAYLYKIKNTYKECMKKLYTAQFYTCWKELSRILMELEKFEVPPSVKDHLENMMEALDAKAKGQPPK